MIHLVIQYVIRRSYLSNNGYETIAQRKPVNIQPDLRQSVRHRPGLALITAMRVTEGLYKVYEIQDNILNAHENLKEFKNQT